MNDNDNDNDNDDDVVNNHGKKLVSVNAAKGQLVIKITQYTTKHLESLHECFLDFFHHEGTMQHLGEAGWLHCLV